MTSRTARLGAACAVLFAVTLSVAPGAEAAGASMGSAAAAQGIPFVDPHAQGALGFCDRNNKPVTSGSLTDIPFVWKAVSSVPAPSGYVGPLGKATLMVFQPRKEHDPGEWTGIMFTASAKYSNPKHPMTQATTLDRPLLDFTSVAPLWDGYAQVRMYFSNVDRPPHTNPYPAAVIKITGNTWQLASTGPAPACGAGSAVSAETLHIDPKKIPSASPTLLGANGEKLVTATALPTSGAVASTDPGAASASSTTDPVLASGTSATTSSSLPAWAWGALILLPLLGVGGGFIAARRSTPTGSHSS